MEIAFNGHIGKFGKFEKLITLTFSDYHYFLGWTSTSN